MRVLLVYPPHTKEIVMGYPPDYVMKARSDLPPLGLMYLASYLEHRYDVQIVDMSAEDLQPEDITSVIDNFKPDLIGISCVITQWLSVISVASAIKKHVSQTPVVVGGPNPTSYPSEVLSYEEVDYVICGCGQVPLMELCGRLEAKGRTDGIEHCYSKEHPPTKDTPLPKVVNIDNFSFPKRTAVPIGRYTVPFCPDNPTTSMISSQGCCFRCAFCSCRNNKPVQIRSFARVVDEMAEVERLAIRSVMFQDDLFTIDSQRVKRLCEEVIDRGIKLHWTVKSRVDRIKEWMPELMKEAGCFNIHFGIESGNDKTLARMKKDITAAESRKAVRTVKKAGLSCTGNFMLGYPGETEEDICNTIDFAVDVGLDLSQFSITMDLPGTELYNEAVKSGRRKPVDPYREFILDPENNDITRLFSSDYFNEDEMFGFLKEAYSKTKTLYDVKGKPV